MGVSEELKMIPHLKYAENIPLSGKCTLGVGGNAKYYVETYSVKSLAETIETAVAYGIKYKVLGCGSNILFSDKGYDGLIISLKPQGDIIKSGNAVTVTCGTKLIDLVTFTVHHELSGIEKLIGIPATVGGAICRNAGAFGQEISQTVSEVCLLSKGKLKKLKGDECGFSYRNSSFIGSNDVILSATFLLRKDERTILDENVKSCIAVRRETQPLAKSCGCVFKNGANFKAANLLEKAGLKGKRIGGAFVSEKHANFIVTGKDAKAEDVFRLIGYEREKVKETFGVTLETEVELIGEF